mmetsp:Transcript_3393/g.9766  ORF Transcript_3393/g.9766 Transcript_3393/m.9766 type:complete len:213 (-) Transcript_3393:111-749(-)
MAVCMYTDTGLADFPPAGERELRAGVAGAARGMAAFATDPSQPAVDDRPNVHHGVTISTARCWMRAKRQMMLGSTQTKVKTVAISQHTSAAVVSSAVKSSEKTMAKAAKRAKAAAFTVHPSAYMTRSAALMSLTSRGAAVEASGPTRKLLGPPRSTPASDDTRGVATSPSPSRRAPRSGSTRVRAGVVVGSSTSGSAMRAREGCGSPGGDGG